MIDRFLKWVRFDRSHASRTSRDRPAGNAHRRLAIEPIEHRLLLSAAATETIADGGTIVFASDSYDLGDSEFSWDGLLVTAEIKRPSDTPPTTVDLHGTERYGVSGTADALILESGQAKTFTRATNGITAAESEELAPTDLSSSEAETGLADVTHIAHQKVFAEIGTAKELLERNELPNTRPEVQLAQDDSPTAILNAEANTYSSAHSLVGSRGRLAAFDLAIREQTDHLPLDLDAAQRSETVNDVPVPTAKASSPQPNPATSASVTSLQHRLGQAHLELNSAVHDLALADTTASYSSVSFTLPYTTVPNEPIWSETMAIQDSPDAQQDVNSRAVYLDQKRAKPIAHLALFAGAAYVLNGNRQHAADDSEQEQLPPRNRRKRRR